MHGKLLTMLLTLCPILASVAQNPGFFLNDAPERIVSVPDFMEVEKASSAPTVNILVDYNAPIAPVSRYLFGNNANPYMTQMVDQPVLLNHISNLRPNVIRFPGGNISSVFFWNSEKNQPPADAPAKLVDANGNEIDPGYWYGKNSESWTLSLDNYYQMLELTNNTGMITVNYGYARYSTAVDPVASAAHLAAEWVRYDNGRTKFWEIGNESNGTWQAGHRIKLGNNKDGQPEVITGELYGNHFKVFADSMRKAATEIGTTIYIGAQLLQEAPASWWNETDRFWNNGVLKNSQDSPDFYIIHSYYTPYAQNSNAETILKSATEVTRSMMDFVSNEVNNAGLAQKPIALTEWNIFAEGSKQQVSFINGMHAAIVLGELIKGKYGMASRWDLANGWNNGDDHGMFSRRDQPGVPEWTPRPPFYYMYYFQKYFGDTMVSSMVEGRADILAYASDFSSGEGSVVLVNKGATEQVTSVMLDNKRVGERFYYYTLTGGSDNGEFSLKVNVNGMGTTLNAGGPSDYSTLKAMSSKIAGGIKVLLPAKSVTYLLIEKGDNVITAIEKGSHHGFSVSPNPADGRVKVDFNKGEYDSLVILDMKGKTVFNRNVRGVSVLEINEALPPGLYIVHANGARRVESHKLVIR